MEKKYRHEIKYVCTEQEFKMIEARISQICQRDPHVGKDGIYAIRSVYFDDYDNTCFYQNEEGVDNREKYRIRIYNGNSERITLECKQKVNGKNHKDSCQLTKEQCEAILNGTFSFRMVEGYKPAKGQIEVLNKFFVLYSTRLMRGKVIVSYDRTPFIYNAGNVRITFDRNIKGSSKVGDFLEEIVDGRPVMPVGQHILEVKYDELLPDVLNNAMQLGRLRQATYSKYYICRKFCG